ncbi:phytanoyl-CoA dioxygenase family protein [Mycolicibacterium litorale]|uniref:Phytanoyl-CoA dioxygenase n=1 Tax=Mycolicibacterium litorale TaxID=758802 RepID=A0AAD1IJR3_9MYCO|nr:phytanoyl-CoA dioxygenase family protein [Mycolicibacterium litorale]MCV7414878.1 phytanoyl-CoA dioxygenase family protein [Mycolicibacterium litorale]TDY08125.1 phytanoyl-CoA dioxygenase PhyH [Mycolicibacterium litorale]BBY16046.1 phytanoyl-CoA dioxygenase [Mycolicibacterium litorale]
MVDVAAFDRDGFLRIDQPELRSAADAARAVLWEQIGLSPDDPASWTQPVVWASDMTGAGPFAELTGSVRLARVLDALCGAGGWEPRRALGNIPVRFPVRPPVDDRGWHIDMNTPLPDGGWAVSGRPHTLLLLTLLSDVGPDDAPTRIRRGSHHDVAAVLGTSPMDFVEAGAVVDRVSAGRPVVHATGSAGDMYVVDPLTVHAADEHRGRTPRFMAQAPVMLTAPLRPGR